MKMITIVNRLIPLKAYTAFTQWPLLFIRKENESRFDKTSERHEQIHAWQQIETMLLSFTVLALMACAGWLSWWWMLAAPLCFDLLYGLEYLVRLLLYRNLMETYRNVSFEQEAYLRQHDPDYLSYRYLLAWVPFLFRKTWRKRR